MENEPEELGSYEFLTEENVERGFADLNFRLLSGVHIHMDDYQQFTLLENHEIHWRHYYARLYKLNLVRDTFDRHNYYYLDFFEDSKGKMADSSRNRPLSELQTITGLMLLDMYYQLYFEDVKLMTWAMIKKQVTDGEHAQNYQRILFQNLRPTYLDSEWQGAEKKFSNAINRFDHLGWVKKLSAQGDELEFEIKPAIHRLTKLYAYELNNFAEFAANLIKPEES